MEAGRAHRMRREVSRKVFHVASVLIPAAVWFAPREAAVAVLAALAFVALLVDVARLRIRGARYHFLRHTREMLRAHERRQLAGATHMVVAYAAVLVLFPTPIAVAAMLFNGLGDAAAALVGRRFGRHRTRWGKSWEGFLAGAATSTAVALALPGIPPAAAVAAGIAAAALEFAPLPLDDNTRVTLGGGAALWLAVRVIGG